VRANIQQRLYTDWPGDVRRRLASLTLREYSGMRSAVYANQEVTTFVLFEKAIPVAWSIAEWDPYEKEYNIMLYVRRDRRYRGYGKQLFTKAKKWVKATKGEYTIFTDGINNGFFEHMGEEDV
jgi:GNAT superfamily N-acetyltransferase